MAPPKGDVRVCVCEYVCTHTMCVHMCVRAFIDIFLRREGATDISFTSDVFYPFLVTFFLKVQGRKKHLTGVFQKRGHINTAYQERFFVLNERHDISKVLFSLTWCSRHTRALAYQKFLS